MSEDMSEMMNKISGMLNSDTLPDNVKEMLNNFKNSSPKTDSVDESSAESKDSKDSTPSINPEMLGNLMNMFNSGSKQSSDSSSTSSSPNIDFETIMKMKTIMEKMNTKDDPRSNLLLSLKPYLKTSRKDKVEQYVKLFNMSKVMDVFKPTGGDKHHDV